MAILRTKAALGIQQKMQPHPIAPMVASHPVGSMELSEEFVISGSEDTMGIGSAQTISRQSLIGQTIPI